MEQIKQNKMAVDHVKKIFWKMGHPMVVSMVLQALYNVVDSVRHKRFEPDMSFA